jgi:glycosyltransferase involved in cell wall biosynthesis
MISSPEPGNTNRIVPRLNLFKRVVWKVAQAVSAPPFLAFALLVIVPHGRLARRRRLPNIVWGGTPIINIKYGAAADRLYGYKSDTFVFSQATINSKYDYDFVFDRFFQDRGWGHSMVRDAFLGLLSPYYLFTKAAWNYDIFRFYFDGGFLTYTALAALEPWLLHMAGKKIIVVPYGGDARLESQTRQHPINFCMDCVPETRTCHEGQIRRRVNRLCAQADIVLGCADIVNVLPNHEGIWQYPIDLSGWQPVPARILPRPLRVVHATNHRKYKGTHFLVDAVAELKADGHPVELVLVEKMKTAEAKAIYQSADIIADQFIGGAYALFAMEGMALGKPVLCYLRDDLYAYHPEWDECPIYNTNPSNIKEHILKLIQDDKLRADIGARGPAYVQKYHSLEAVGRDDDLMYQELWA